MIRHAEPDDAEQIHEVALKAWRDTYGHILSEETVAETVENWYEVGDLREQTETPIFYVAVDEEGGVVGFVHATVEDTKATLHRIYIDPEYQARGIGSRLYRRMEEDLQHEEAEKVEVEVLAENQKGNSFYRKHGFETNDTEQVELNGEEVCQEILLKNLRI